MISLSQYACEVVLRRVASVREVRWRCAVRAGQGGGRVWRRREGRMPVKNPK